MKVNSNSVLLDDSSALELEELVDVAAINDTEDTEETNEIDKLKREIAQKETEYNSVKVKCDLVTLSFEQVTKKIDTIDKDYKDAIATIDSQKLKIQQFEEKIINSLRKYLVKFKIYYCSILTL